MADDAGRQAADGMETDGLVLSEVVRHGEGEVALFLTACLGRLSCGYFHPHIETVSELIVGAE